MFDLEIARDAVKTAQIVRRACVRCCEVHEEQVAAAPWGCSLGQKMWLSGAGWLHKEKKRVLT